MTAGLAKIVILRFSAMGDVALLAPVLKSAADENPEAQLTLITRPKFLGLFSNLKSIEVISADVDADYRGLIGLWKLTGLIRKMDPTTVVDVHDHLRTKLIRFFLKLYGIQFVVFDKGRREKKSFIKSKNKENLKPLPHTCERYRLALIKAGLKITPAADPPFNEYIKSQLPLFLTGAAGKRLIGLAPFAAHFTKMWPLEKFREVLKNFSNEKDITFLLFGGGKTEKEKLDSISAEFSNCINIAGKLSLTEELSLMNHLDLMICVDSSNMHLAALAGIPVFSIWGGTHIDTGFGPFPNPNHRIIEIPNSELSCRPCSVYGLPECPRKDHACMQQIGAETVTEALREMLVRLPNK